MATTGLLLLPACGNGGCTGFDPQSEPLPVGSSTTLDVVVTAGRLATVDVDGGYYEQPRTAGSTPLRDGPRRATVRHEEQGLVLVLDERSITLEGPLGCD